jgi:hypothetical protein
MTTTPYSATNSSSGIFSGVCNKPDLAGLGQLQVDYSIDSNKNLIIKAAVWQWVPNSCPTSKLLIIVESVAGTIAVLAGGWSRVLLLRFQEVSVR